MAPDGALAAVSYVDAASAGTVALWRLDLPAGPQQVFTFKHGHLPSLHLRIAPQFWVLVLIDEVQHQLDLFAPLRALVTRNNEFKLFVFVFGFASPQLVRDVCDLLSQARRKPWS